jgi:hypothetical protein
MSPHVFDNQLVDDQDIKLSHADLTEPLSVLTLATSPVAAS